MKITNTTDYHLIVSKIRNSRIPVVVAPGSILDVDMFPGTGTVEVTIQVANRAETPEECSKSDANEARAAAQLVAGLDPKQREHVKAALQD